MFVTASRCDGINTKLVDPFTRTSISVGRPLSLPCPCSTDCTNIVRMRLYVLASANEDNKPNSHVRQTS